MTLIRQSYDLPSHPDYAEQKAEIKGFISQQEKMLEDGNQTSILTESYPEITHHYSHSYEKNSEQNQFYRLMSSDRILKAISGQS